MTLKLLSTNSQKTGLARLVYEASSFNRHPGTHILYLVSARSYALTLANAGLMESIRRNVKSSVHTVDSVEIHSFQDESTARSFAKSF